MKNVLIVSGHTDLNDSVANKKILEELKEKLPEAEFDYLIDLYPDFTIDVEAEQEKLVNADIIVLQYPLFWYSMPSIMERWMEEAFAHGFSHGSTGDKLKGKKIIASFTAGAPGEAYTKEGVFGCDIEDFLNPIKSACILCQMEYGGMVFTPGVSYQIRDDQSEEIIEKADDHAQRLVDLIESL